MMGWFTVRCPHCGQDRLEHDRMVCLKALKQALQDAQEEAIGSARKYREAVSAGGDSTELGRKLDRDMERCDDAAMNLIEWACEGAVDPD